MFSAVLSGATNKEANVIVVTALGHEPLVRQALKLGSKDFVIKPFKVEHHRSGSLNIVKKLQKKD